MISGWNAAVIMNAAISVAGALTVLAWPSPPHPSRTCRRFCSPRWCSPSCWTAPRPTILGEAYPNSGPSPTLAVYDTDSTLNQYQQLADVVICVSIPIAGCTLAASVAGGLSDRKRPFSLLRLTGARLRLLQSVVTLESAVPLVVVALLSIGAGLAASALFLHWQMNYALASPGIGYFGIVLAALVLALAIVAATFPLLRRITGPETARNE